MFSLPPFLCLTAEMVKHAKARAKPVIPPEEGITHILLQMWCSDQSLTDCLLAVAKMGLVWGIGDAARAVMPQVGKLFAEGLQISNIGLVTSPASGVDLEEEMWLVNEAAKNAVFLARHPQGETLYRKTFHAWRKAGREAFQYCLAGLFGEYAEVLEVAKLLADKVVKEPSADPDDYKITVVGDPPHDHWEVLFGESMLWRFALDLAYKAFEVYEGTERRSQGTYGVVKDAILVSFRE